ncbi:tRNA (adenosine(37)-N6)-threonylcarbamoyltransferase complex ATPase subunit type 1 TsaE [Salinarimonas ramus]|uniref:tRNA threonylcarbamoyladenosine biosynthesis protein TsaE n=1 Tax=Salinarimonas ramus TaxID=690164 RepID=A0A917Q7Y7_9HYPH|nr:tRNA (adenosine(37)-N6)-threonylcarbamoyltransferase complex ATPase subunit type 1 TsaE [Salinarimonas ramus]GGK33022.1 bifunctional tRNA (adenosine(37)-N6)-threonylcarbamoyltransferase complex ATPase subunit type 1 TsaE/phosphotransferase [Salinarimonas ramus]
MPDRGLMGLPPGPDPRLPVWEVLLDDEQATRDMARFIADELKPGDVVTLSGGLGAGKTTLARAIVRALAGDPGLEVPSPTFTLMQTYDTRKAPVVHADFYRLGSSDELVEMGWEEATEGAVTLVEWPDRAAGALSASRLDITLDIVSADGAQARVAILVGVGAFGERLVRARALKGLLARAGWTGARRTPMTGDASTRAYERLTRETGENAVLMIAPRRPDGPPIRQGKPYSAIARLAESVHAFVAVDRGLRSLGLSAPRILGEALDEGLLLLEDLGAEPVVDANGPIPERYAEAARLLVGIHATTLPHVLPVADEIEHVIPPYDEAALTIEVELFVDWYLRFRVGHELSSAARADFLNAWREALADVIAAPATWTLRDYHSPNLIWLPEREGVARLGLIDFQDAVLGHPAYDLVSLAQDARVDVAPELELKLLSLYARERRARDPAFDVAAFARDYAILGAQRATKILGIFVRLDRRDRKPGYLAHLPRLEAYLARNLAHPALARLKAWYETHAPRLLAPAAGSDET